jgi:hypothetical protein
MKSTKSSFCPQQHTCVLSSVGTFCEICGKETTIELKSSPPVEDHRIVSTEKFDHPLSSSPLPILKRKKKSLVMNDPKYGNIDTESSIWRNESQEIRELIPILFETKRVQRNIAEQCIQVGIRDPIAIRARMTTYGCFTESETQELVDIALVFYQTFHVKRSSLRCAAVVSWYTYATASSPSTSTKLADKLNWTLIAFRLLHSLGIDTRECSRLLRKSKRDSQLEHKRKWMAPVCPDLSTTVAKAATTIDQNSEVL